MNAARFAPAPLWRRGALFLAIVAMMLPVLAGCSSDINQPAEPQSGLALDGQALPQSLAPDFCPTLPDYDVVVIHSQPGSDNTLFDIWFWGIGEGFDISTNDTLPGWCVEDYPHPNVQDPGRVYLYCSYDDALPGNLSDMPINELNYLLNNRYGTWQEIQAAMWLVLGFSEPSIPPTANSYAMYEDTMANGGDFVPGPGELVAIFLYTGDGGTDATGVFQETIVELRLPGDNGGGSDACTPGYWRTHFDRWPEGYLPSDDFDTVFGTDYFDPDITLGMAIWARGGGLNKLARHGTAALLNAAHGSVDYPYSVAEVIAMVQAGEADMLADTNDELDCPLEGTPADPQAHLGGKY